jgi:hypothetical protein
VSEQLQEVLSLLKTDITCWNDAARQCEMVASKLSGQESAECMLLSAVYRERAELLSDAIQKAASNSQPSTAERAFRDSGQNISS